MSCISKSITISCPFNEVLHCYNVLNNTRLRIKIPTCHNCWKLHKHTTNSLLHHLYFVLLQHHRVFSMVLKMQSGFILVKINTWYSHHMMMMMMTVNHNSQVVWQCRQNLGNKNKIQFYLRHICFTLHPQNK